MHHESEWGPRPERECGDEVHMLGKKIEPVWPFLDGLDIRYEDLTIEMAVFQTLNAGDAV
jgi:hypothetical protein